MWNEGYVSEIDYTYGYYSELNPLRSRFALLSSGIKPPLIKNACELGFGQGISLMAHAAGSKTKWFGNDFNPSQALYARELSVNMHPELSIEDEDFETYCSRDDLPKFDFISLHGIWSWVSDKNREIISNFLKEKLNIGGVVYVSYNVPPGWSGMIDIREMLVSFAENQVAGGQSLSSKVTASLKFASEFLDLNPIFAKANPGIRERLKLMQKQDPHYLAHEYFNKDWEPMHFTKISEILSDAKLSFVTSANLLDNVQAINFDDAQLKFLNSIQDVSYREFMKDLLVHQTFRKDYWMKGPLRLSSLERNNMLANMNFSLLKNPDQISMKVKGHRGEADLNNEVYPPIFDVLAREGTLSFSALVMALGDQVTSAQILEALTILSGKGDVAICNANAEALEREKYTKMINERLAEEAKAIDKVNYLMSPVTGGCVHVGRFEKLMLLAIREGLTEKADIADFIWNILQPQKQKLIKDGKTLESDQENIEELNNLVNAFLMSRQKILNRLMVTV